MNSLEQPKNPQIPSTESQSKTDSQQQGPPPKGPVFNKEANKVKITIEDSNPVGAPKVSTVYAAGFILLTEEQYLDGEKILRTVNINTNFNGRPYVVDIIEMAKLQLYLK